eukprot:jgi/Undpi1/7791/HiC_scaffold_23.g10264.m1
MSCGEGSRLELQPILTKFAPIPGSECVLTVCERAEEKAHSARGVGSASFRRNEAKAMVVAHVVDLLRCHGVLLVSENCVLSHGAVEEKADPTAPPPMAAAAAPEKRPAQKERRQVAGSGSLSGEEAAGNSSTPEPVGDDESQDDRDQVHSVTVQSYSSEIGLLVVDIVRVMRNSDERYSWFDLNNALLQASRLAQDTGFERERTILDKVIFRGQRMMSLCHKPSQVLVTWTQLLPNTRGAEQKQLLRDVKALHWAQRPHVGHPKRGGYPGGSVNTPSARGPSVFAGPPVILPLHEGQGKGRSKARAGQPGQSHGQAVRATPNLCQTENWR